MRATASNCGAPTDRSQRAPAGGDCTNQSWYPTYSPRRRQHSQGEANSHPRRSQPTAPNKAGAGRPGPTPYWDRPTAGVEDARSRAMEGNSELVSSRRRNAARFRRHKHTPARLVRRAMHSRGRFVIGEASAAVSGTQRQTDAARGNARVADANKVGAPAEATKNEAPRNRCASVRSGRGPSERYTNEKEERIDQDTHTAAPPRRRLGSQSPCAPQLGTQQDAAVAASRALSLRYTSR